MSRMKALCGGYDASALMTSVNRQLRDFCVDGGNEWRRCKSGLSRTLRRCTTPGLRREEVAEFAGSSIDSYAGLEQGRGEPQRKQLPKHWLKLSY